MQKDQILRVVLYIFILILMLDGMAYMIGKKNFPVLRWALHKIKGVCIWTLKFPFRALHAGFKALFKTKKKGEGR
ncbi:hypothetical protein L6259_03720 [Candidatus Parcubacteria bacterium]|nr:hypothetical protein [Patescibacteria group bacterium]MCG2694344.1 hypothetical protein [Candidatus Parcubacteria bacterium]